MKAMAARPEARYPDALALAAEISRYLDGGRVQAYPETLFRKAGRFYQKHKLAIWLVLTYIIARGLILLFLGR
jgi:hypothetical protein